MQVTTPTPLMSGLVAPVGSVENFHDWLELICDRVLMKVTMRYNRSSVFAPIHTPVMQRAVVMHIDRDTVGTFASATKRQVCPRTSDARRQRGGCIQVSRNGGTFGLLGVTSVIAWLVAAVVCCHIS